MNEWNEFLKKIKCYKELYEDMNDSCKITDIKETEDILGSHFLMI